MRRAKRHSASLSLEIRHLRSPFIASLIVILLFILVTGCGSGQSANNIQTTSLNPVPSIAAFSPASISPGAPGFTLVVNGSNLIPGSIVRWNGSNRTTIFVSSSQVTANIPSRDIAEAATVAITIVNPSPGGGSSKPAIFAIEPDTAEVWRVVELAFNTQATYSNPFTDVTVSCQFIGPAGERLIISGFYDGNGVWRVRFAPTAVGAWSYQTASTNPTDHGLHSISGQLNITAGVSTIPFYVHGGFLRVSSTRRFLTYTDGTPFFWLGDTWWSVPSPLLPMDTDPGFRTLVEKRKQQQFSVVQMAFQGPDWGAMVDSARARMLDVAFWQNADRYFAYLNENGLVAAVTLCFGGQLKENDLSLDDWKFLWSYVISRYGAFAVLWIATGEYNVYNVPDLVEEALALGQFIKATDPYKRAMSVHPWWYGEDQRQAWNQPWYDFVMIQGGHLAPPAVPTADVYTAAYALTPPKPVLQAECDYEGIYGGTVNEIMPGQVRRVAYQAIQMGSFGYTYGAHGIWYPTQSWDDTTTWSDWGTSPPYWVAVDRPGAAQMQVLHNFYESMDWWNLEPRTGSLIFMGINPLEDPFQAWAKGYGDELYTVYFPEGSDPKAAYELQLQAASQRNFSVTWFNPRTGARTSISELVSCSGGLCIIPQRPGNEDWMLVLDAVH